MYFLVNVYSPKPLDVVTSNLHRAYDVERTGMSVLGNIMYDLGHIM